MGRNELKFFNTLSKWAIGDLNKCVVDDLEKMSIRIPLNTKIINQANRLDFVGKLWISVEFGGQFVKNSKIELLDEIDENEFIKLDFEFSDKEHMWLDAIAQESLVYYYNDDVKYNKFHNME